MGTVLFDNFIVVKDKAFDNIYSFSNVTNILF